MRISVFFWSLVTTLGSVATLIGLWLVARGPFLGGPPVPQTLLLAGLVGFILGLVITSYGGLKLTYRLRGI